MAQRIALALVAILAVAWLAVSYRDARLHARGSELARLPAEQLDAATVRESDDLLRRARLLNPDRTLAYDRAVLMLRAGRRDEGIERLERYLRAEPEHREAWGIYAVATAEVRPEASRRALRRYRELGPAEAR
jgi:predicted Zn-dependent protease